MKKRSNAFDVFLEHSPNANNDEKGLMYKTVMNTVSSLTTNCELSDTTIVKFASAISSDSNAHQEDMQLDVIALDTIKVILSSKNINIFFRWLLLREVMAAPNTDSSIYEFSKRSLLDELQSEAISFPSKVTDLPKMNEMMEQLIDSMTAAEQQNFLLAIMPIMFANKVKANTRKITNHIAMKLVQTVNYTHLTINEKAILSSNKIDSYMRTIKNLCEKNNDNWYALWLFLMRFFHASLHMERTVMNNLLAIVEYAFRKVDSLSHRSRAYDCWMEIIENFSMDMKFMCSPKKMQVLLSPLKIKQENTSLTLKKFQTFVLLIKKVKHHYPNCLEEYLQFCTTLLADNVIDTKTQVTNRKVVRNCTKSLLEILGHNDTKDDCKVHNVFEFDQPLIHADNFQVFYTNIIACSFYALHLLNLWCTFKEFNAVTRCILKLLLNLVNTCDANATYTENVYLEIEINLKRLLDDIGKINLNQNILMIVLDLMLLEPQICEKLQSTTFQIAIELLVRNQYTECKFDVDFAEGFVIACLQSSNFMYTAKLLDFYTSNGKFNNTRSLSKLWPFCNFTSYSENIHSINFEDYIFWPIEHDIKFSPTIQTHWRQIFTMISSTNNQFTFLIFKRLESFYKVNGRMSINHITMWLLHQIIIGENYLHSNIFVENLFSFILRILKAENLREIYVHKFSRLLFAIINKSTMLISENSYVDVWKNFLQCADVIIDKYKFKPFLKDLSNTMREVAKVNDDCSLLNENWVKELEDSVYDEFFGINTQENHGEANEMSENNATDLFESLKLMESKNVNISCENSATNDFKVSDKRSYKKIRRQRRFLPRLKKKVTADVKPVMQTEELNMQMRSDDNPSFVTIASDIFEIPQQSDDSLINIDTNDILPVKRLRKNNKKFDDFVNETKPRRSLRNLHSSKRCKRGRGSKQIGFRGISNNNNNKNCLYKFNNCSDLKPVEVKIESNLYDCSSYYTENFGSDIKIHKVESLATVDNDNTDQEMDNRESNCFEEEEKKLSASIISKNCLESSSNSEVQLSDSVLFNLENVSHFLDIDDTSASRVSFDELRLNVTDNVLQNDIETQNNVQTAMPNTLVTLEHNYQVSNISSSPVTVETPERNEELLNDTEDISPISYNNEFSSSTPTNSNTNFNNYPRAARLLKLVNSNQKLPPSTSNVRKLPLTPPIRGRPPTIKTSNRTNKIFYNYKHDNETKEINTSDNKEENIKFLYFSKDVPSSLLTPTKCILKRKLENENTPIIVTPSPKRKRVNFSDPPTSELKMYERDYEEDNCNNNFTFETNDQIEIIQNYIFPDLKDCEESIDCLMEFLCDPLFEIDLKAQIKCKGINTIGHLAKLSSSDIESMLFKMPKVSTVELVLNMYFRFGTGQKPTIPKETTSSDQIFDSLMNDSQDRTAKKSAHSDVNTMTDQIDLPYILSHILHLSDDEFHSVIEDLNNGSISLQDQFFQRLSLILNAKNISKSKNQEDSDVQCSLLNDENVLDDFLSDKFFEQLSHSGQAQFSEIIEKFCNVICEKLPSTSIVNIQMQLLHCLKNKMV